MSSELFSLAGSFSKASRWMVLLVLIVGLTAGASASIVEDSFEDGDYNGWSDRDSEYQTLEVVDVSGADGDKALKLENSGSYGPLTYDLPSSYSSGVYTFEMKVRLEEKNNLIQSFRPLNNPDGLAIDYSSYFDSSDNFEMGYSSNLIKSSPPTGEFFDLKYVMDLDSNTISAFYNGDEKVDSEPIENTDELPLGTFAVDYRALGYLDNFKFCEGSCNEKPQFNSTDITPDPPLIGENVSYGAEVYDSDGSIDYTNLTLSYGGSTVVSDAQRSGTTTPEWNDIYKPKDGNKWLNATLEVVDDQGAVTSTEINRYLSDDAPTVTLNDPSNSTYFKYDVPLDVTVSDSDSKPGEDWTCTVDKDGSQIDSFYLLEGTNSTYSDTVRSDVGSHTVEVSCTDGSGNTGTASETYTVNDYKIEGVGATDPTTETVETQYFLDLRQGKMVDNITKELVYNGGDTGVTREYIDLDGTTDLKDSEFYFRPPLASSNPESFDWYVNVVVEKKDVNGNNVVDTFNSSLQTQSVKQGFNISATNTESQYLEFDKFDYELELSNASKVGEVVSLTGEQVTNQQTGEVSLLDRQSSNSNTVKFTAETQWEDVSSSNETHSVLGELTLNFRDKTRTLQKTDSADIYQMQLAKCSELSNSDKVLQFNSFEEEDRDNATKSNLELSLEYYNPDQTDFKRNLSTLSADKTQHKICKKPSFGEIIADSSQKLIQFEEGDSLDTDYSRRSTFLIQQPLKDNLVEVPLYMLPRSEATEVTYSLVDSDDDPLTDKIVRVERYFADEGNHVQVANFLTDAQGQSRTYVKVNEFYYRYKVFNKNGELEGVIPPEGIGNIVTSVDQKLVLGEQQTDNWFDYKDSVGYDCFTEENLNNQSLSDLVCDYTSDTDDLSTIKLEVEKKGSFGWETVNTSSSSTSNGMLRVKALDLENREYRYTLTAFFDNNEIRNVLESQSLGTVTSKYGDSGLMITFMMFITLSFAGLWKSEVTITLGSLALVMAYYLDFLALSQTALASALALAAVLIWRMM